MEPAKAIARSALKDPSQRVPGMPPNWGDKVVPHVMTFQGILASISRVYRNSDEAIKDSFANARYMLNDLTILECIEQRMRSTALLGWHLEVDNEKDPHQKALKKALTDILKRIPRFMQYREALLRAIWYGRYAVQHRYEWGQVDGSPRVLVKQWLPVHGDKLAFGYDQGGPLQDRVGIRVGPALATGDVAVAEWRARSRNKIQPTDYGLAYFLDPWERDLLAIHKHLIEDGEFEEPINAGRIHGLGIRSRIYWTWFQKQELLAWLMEYLERSAFGIEIWYYPWGNDKARDDLRTAAEERIGQGRNIVLVPKPIGEEGQSYGLDRIEPGMAGADIVKDILQNYFGHLIKRYILGQTLTSEAESTGLGSNLASVHLDTYLQIIKYDAVNLEETVTTELVDRIKGYNFPEMLDVPCRFRIETEVADVESKLAAWKNAFEMGAKLREKDVMELIGAAMPEPGDAVLDQESIQPDPMGMGIGPAGPGQPGGPMQLDLAQKDGIVPAGGNGHAPTEDVKTVMDALQDNEPSTEAKFLSHWMRMNAAERQQYAKEFDESSHPRVGKGSPEGGQFGGGSGGAAESSPKSREAGDAKADVLSRMKSGVAKAGPKGKRYLQTAEQVLGKMSSSAISRLRANVQEFVWYPGVGELTQAVTGQANELVGGAWERQIGTARSLGVGGDLAESGPRGSRLHLDGGGETGEHTTSTSAGIYSHEFSHAIDVLPDGRLISQTDEWEGSWEDEILEGKVHLTEYAMSDPTEGFAEYGRLVYIKPAEARELFPKCWAIWEKAGLT